MSDKKVISIQSDSPIANTGLGRNVCALAKYLHSTGKYEVVLYCHGHPWSSPDLKKLPFRAYGCLPDNQNELIAIQHDQGRIRDASYGSLKIDEFIKEVKPFAHIMSNDSWAFPYLSRPWWNKFHCLPHITLDSTPFLRDQIDLIKGSRAHYVWAKFAEEEAKRLGFKNVETIPAIIDPSYFKPLSALDKNTLRNRFNIPQDTFICGFVFRSQLRKEVKPLLLGFAQFKKDNPQVKNAKLLLHTHFGEGWDIPKLAEDSGVDIKDILTTYVCRDCGQYEIKSFAGQDQPCRFCGSEKGQVTCNVMQGVTEEQLNEVYNLMDCYCHLANAGGCEMPVIEALYAGLPVATVSYSFGKTFTDEPCVYTIDHATTIQFGTQFDRAAPYPSSVAKFLKKIFNSDKWAREQIGQKGRNFALATFSPEVVGAKWEKVIDALSEVNYDYDFTPKPKNPNYIPPDGLSDNDFITALYDNLLFQPEPENGEGRKHWLTALKQSVSRQDVYNYFVKVALDDNAKNTKITLDSFFDKDDEGKRILFAIPTEAEDVINLTSLFKSCKETYPEYNIYVATKPEHKSLLRGNPYVHKWLNFIPEFENTLVMEGVGQHKGPVDILFLPHIQSSKFPSHLHNGKDKNNLIQSNSSLVELIDFMDKNRNEIFRAADVLHDPYLQTR